MSQSLSWNPANHFADGIGNVLNTAKEMATEVINISPRIYVASLLSGLVANYYTPMKITPYQAAKFTAIANVVHTLCKAIILKLFDKKGEKSVSENGKKPITEHWTTAILLTNTVAGTSAVAHFLGLNISPIKGTLLALGFSIPTLYALERIQ